MQPQIAWTCTTGSQYVNGFAQFLLKIKKLRQLHGTYLCPRLSYNMYSIDKLNRTNFMQRVFSSPSNSGYRHYLLYLPRNPKPNMPLVMLLHGTGSNMFTTQLIFVKSNLTVWLDLADSQSFVIAVPQARTVTLFNTKNIVWQSGNQDLLYIQDVVHDIAKQATKQWSLDMKNINFVGKSNGGLFVGELYMFYASLSNQEVMMRLKFRPNLFCNYMGGLQYEQPDYEIVKFNEKRKKTPILIMTCPGEDNYRSCLRARQFLDYHGCNLNYIEINHNKHEFLPQCAPKIYQFINKSYKEYLETQK